MNKVIILILIIVGYVQVSFAQIQLKDSTEAYNYWANRGIIEAVYAYMNDYIVTVGEANSQAEIQGKGKYFNEVINGIESKETLPTFIKISTLLKANSWIGAEKTLFSPLKKNFDNKTPLNELFFKSKKPGSNDLITVIPGKKNKNENWDTKTKEIIFNYNTTLGGFAKEKPGKLPEKSPEPSSFDNPISKPEIQERNISEKITPKQIPLKSYLVFASIFFIGLIVGGWLIFVISKKKIYSILDVEKHHYIKKYLNNGERFIFKYIGVVYILKKQKDLYKNESESNGRSKGYELINLENKISRLENEKKELLDENNELGKQIEEKCAGSIRKTGYDNPKPLNSKYEAPPKMMKLFFNMPKSDGSFQMSNGEPLNDGKKYFKIEFEDSSNCGELFYLPSERDQKAINRLESFLKPVCDIENISNDTTATKIELIQSGKVSLINSGWIINPDKKIKIRLY